MFDSRKAVFAVSPTVVAVGWLSVVFGSLAGPLHAQPLQDLQLDGVERALHVLNAANELCLRSKTLQAETSLRVDLLVEMAVAQSRTEDVAKAGEMFQLALKAASNIKDTGEHFWALLRIAEGQAIVGSVDAAVRTSELATSPKKRASILGLVAGSLSTAGNTQDALTLARLIPEEYREMRDAAVCEVASDMAARGECSQALALLEGIKVDMAHAQTLQLSQRAGANLTPAEEAIVSEAASKAIALLNVAECQARASRFVEATKVAKMIGFGRFRDRALRNTASIAVNAGNLEAARRIAAQIRDEEEKNLALGHIAVGKAAKGLLDDSLKTVAAMTRAGDKSNAMIRIAVALARSGDFARAEKTFSAADKEQVEPAERVAAEIAIAQAFAEHGRFTSAIDIAERLPNQAARARIMATIGAAYTKAGRDTDAQRSFQKAYECALRIRTPYETTQVLCEVAASQVAARDHRGAARMLKEAARIAMTIPATGGTNVIALREVAVAQAQSGDLPAARATFHAALAAAKAYADEEYAATLCQDVMKAQTECGDSETALESANKLESGVIKCRSLLGIALGLLPEWEE